MGDFDLCNSSGRTLAGLIARRRASSREVVTAFLDRIDVLNPTYNAVVTRLDPTEVLRAADAADAAVKSGDPLGPLHGLPHAIKETTPVKGLRTTFGSPLFADFIPKADALVVERIRRAGAIFIGKTNAPEFGLGSHTYNPVFGATANAWDPSRSAGGSSGGAAVALALRMLPLADGSDMGGSLRNPAAFNNVLGLRPSQGRVPRWPRTDAFDQQLVTEGPMARSADDLALLLSVQGGFDARAPLSLGEPTPDWGAQLAADLGGRRIGWLGDLGGYLPFESGILQLCEEALERFGVAGIAVEPADTAFEWSRAWRAFVVLRQLGLGGQFAESFDDPRRRPLMKPELQWEVEAFRRLAPADVVQAFTDRTAVYDLFQELFQRFDYLALPSAQVFPFPIELDWPKAIGGREMDSYHRWMEVVVPGTLSGCPVLSLPAGFGAEGLPIGVQIIGRPREDLSVLQLAHLHEQLAPFLTLIPPAALG